MRDFKGDAGERSGGFVAGDFKAADPEIALMLLFHI
jgi:hypothetical protein